MNQTLIIKTFAGLFFIKSLLLLPTVNAFEQEAGIVNFNVNTPPINHPGQQNVQLFGCNNTVVTANLNWAEDNQLLTVPYGSQKTESGTTYHLSKYYLASPPVPLKVPENQTTNIGLLTPDRFVFQGERPAQIVNFDYSILTPTYLRHVPVNFGYQLEGEFSCAEIGVDAVPINTDCPNFPWKNGALGASGIGYIQNQAQQNQVFIPTLEPDGKAPLQCSVSALNDIMLNVRVLFDTGEGLRETLDLTKHYLDKRTIQLVCMPRFEEELPPGCMPAD